ncbi:MAG: NADH-quinone oxidoreductase subunit J [Candidatus Micrarchaeia archaeon]
MPILLLASCLLLVLFSLGIFLSRKLLRSVILLALAAIGSAALLAVIGEEIIAILQILIFVGGISTYMVVAFGSELELKRQSAKTEKIRLVAFLGSFVLLSALLVFIFVGATYGSASQQADLLAYVSSTFDKYYLFLYLLLLMLFAVTISSILAVKRFIRRVPVIE